MKELVIDKKTNINNIKDKDVYEKLTLKCKVNPNKLKGFKNVKELIIDYIDKKNNNYNEQNINKLPFKEKIEKLIFKKCSKFGSITTMNGYKSYNLYLPNLKSIEFPSYIKNISGPYTKKLNNLEEITFNLMDENVKNRAYIAGYIGIKSSKFKKIIIKDDKNKYEIIPDYKIDYITNLDTSYNNILLNYKKDNVETNITIDTEKGIISKNNVFQIYNDNASIYIPDYITELYDYVFGNVEKISLNLNLLKYVKKYDKFMASYNALKTIELRSNNEMSLMPSKVINVSEYGNLENLFIENNLLCLDYDSCKLTINSNGEIIKNVKKIENSDLNNHSLEELETYASYLRLLKISNDLEYQNAMKVVEKTLTKKYIKFY